MTPGGARGLSRGTDTSPCAAAENGEYNRVTVDAGEKLVCTGEKTPPVSEVVNSGVQVLLVENHFDIGRVAELQ